jgi:hypothetical protein
MAVIGISWRSSIRYSVSSRRRFEDRPLSADRSSTQHIEAGDPVELQ